MTDQSSPSDIPQALHRRTRLPGLVLAIPIAAVAIVTYLGVQALSHRGTLITVTFDYAADVHPGDTKVLYEGAQAGELVKITPNKDGRRIDYQLRMISEVPASVLTTSARFWLIGVTPSLSDITSLKAVVSGVAIGFMPGVDGSKTTHFEGMGKAPIVMPRDRGRFITLTAQTLGAIRERSELIYHGQSVGKVTDIEFVNPTVFRLKAFVYEPYDSLITPQTQFWKMSPLRLSLAGGSVSADLAPASTILSGAIELDTPSPMDGKPATEKSVSPVSNAESSIGDFVLYPSEAAAREPLPGTAVRYEFLFPADTGGFAKDAPVSLLSFHIGKVETARLVYEPHTGRPQTLVTAVIYPRNLAVADAAGLPGADVRSATDEAIGKLLHLGFRATLTQTPALIGSRAVSLAPYKGAKGGALDYSGENPRIPVAGKGADFAEIMAQADQLLSNINRVPIAQIGDDVKRLTGRASALVSAPATEETLAHLHSASAKLDQILTEAQPQIAPMMMKLNHATGQLSGDESDAQGAGLPELLRQLTEAARSLHTLTDYLERHPESLIRGRSADK